MGMAKLAGAPVIIVGDIDRGGVFASLAGTMLLFDLEEKARVKGFIINKFRGDVNLLRPGLRMLEEITNVDVLGVDPYMNVDIEEEDSLSESIDKRKLLLSEQKESDLKKYKESQYDILADCMRNSLDMDKIYKIIGLKR